MSTQAMPFQTPTSLFGTLAAYEAQRSTSASPGLRDGSSTPVEVVANTQSLPADAIYQRSLPSLHFLRWRPMYHMQAPSGWMNDPCAPGYDSTTGLYHLFFQWNSKRNIYGAVSWGNISWGHAISKDMIHWTVSGTTTLKPGSWYDREGCLTGCMIPTSLDGKPGEITLFYTGVSRLPIHYTLPYKNTTETLAIAQSRDGGANFVKMRGNPVHPQPPTGMVVTGWRDPFVAPWPAMDKLLDQDTGKTLYGIISGGIKDLTPSAFLYAVNPKDLTQWVYINAIINVGLNHNVSRWSGDLGINWEGANFMTLTSEIDGSSRDFIVVGGEGSSKTHPNSTFAQHPQQQTRFPRSERSLQWMCGSLRMATGQDGKRAPMMDYVSGGRFDHSAMYGVKSFRDPRSGRQTAWGWISEEDLPQRLVDRQNWSGMLSIPREMHLVCMQRVTGAMKSRLKEITSIEIEPDSHDTFTIRTLGVLPASSTETLRQGAKYVGIEQPQQLSEGQKCFLDIQTFRFELMATFVVSDHCSRIGLSIHHTEMVTETSTTQIYLTPATETITIQRPDSTHIDPEVVSHVEEAPFTLFSQKQRNGQIEQEYLQIRAFFDESVLEVFINDRCAFATRIYPCSKRCWGLSFWAEDESRNSALIGAQAWDGLRADMLVSS